MIFYINLSQLENIKNTSINSLGKTALFFESLFLICLSERLEVM